MMMMSAMVVDEKLPGQFASKRFISILPQSAGFLVLGYPPAVGRGRQYNVSLDSISTSFLHRSFITYYAVVSVTNNQQYQFPSRERMHTGLRIQNKQQSYAAVY
jgi:hypothetical protein